MSEGFLIVNAQRKAVHEEYVPLLNVLGCGRASVLISKLDTAETVPFVAEDGSTQLRFDSTKQAGYIFLRVVLPLPIADLFRADLVVYQPLTDRHHIGDLKEDSVSRLINRCIL